MTKLETQEVLASLFHPRRDPAGLKIPEGAGVVSARVAPGVTLGGRLHPAKPDSPVLVFFHGNGEIAADYDPIAPLFTRLGLTFLIWDYRGYGRSDGSPGCATMLSDALRVFEATPVILDGYCLRPSKVVVMGRSLGSAAAIEVARRALDPVAGLVVESGFADTFALLRRHGLSLLGEEATEGFGNASKLEQIAAPTLFLHGEEDRIIPLSEGRALHRASGAARKRLITIPGAGHNDLMLLGLARYFDGLRALVADEPGAAE